MTKMARRENRRKKHGSSNLSSSVVATLKEQIVHWHYPPEHRLTEDELCKTFGMSRSPVREALRVLASDGFVKKLPNRGYVVKQHTIEEIEELYEVRLALELYAVECLASKTQTTKLAAELADLTQTWTELLKESSKKPEEFAILDTLFHDTLARVLGNKSLLRHLRTINERLRLFRMLDFQRRDRAEHTCHQHLKILERIRVRDPQGARAAMQKNIEEGRHNIGIAIKDALARAYLKNT
ncbi:GntR family transcriptional regulator [Candidatus Nitrospira nitrificans]|uniref:Transcriptional regulator, GntR family n=1 Tax=Candidatus Nitrospira nitrificans TaxID=1742973 RepID=A0A0S4LF76_9BACT|nr:GntR family transcriptional regulator [Candidatus Nitrospira nitrificans]CUS35887.1 Transcriptional regulator, GntR family [Candidatus Nitrospira nitrificans]